MRIVFVVVCLLLSMGSAMAQMPPCTAVPGWTQQGEARSFDADNLFEYMDGNAEGYGQYQLGRESFLSLPQEVRDVRCKDCGSCSVQCPNGVQVSKRLQIAQELFA